jgi:hypothetical protein
MHAPYSLLRLSEVTDVVVDCPQFDALDIMTTREHLEFYARAKGIKNVTQDVDLVMEKIGLKAYETRLASKLSGGNKRKLSLAIALLGLFPLFFHSTFSSSWSIRLGMLISVREKEIRPSSSSTNPPPQ